MQNPIGVNLNATGSHSQGGRKYMEDAFSVAYQCDDDKNLEYAFFGVFDGHGGAEASDFAREHLMDSIVEQKLFWSDDDDDVLRAIREGYIATHYAMWREQDKWPKTATGFPSTAGTTASIAFIRHSKLYIGHVGDSGIMLGYQEEGEDFWRAQPLTQDHKPECNIEQARIINSGGKVMIKSGVHRVVWNRPRLGHKGPVRRSTPIDEIPFLAVARSLGDLWSYNSALNEFVVSPDPDVQVIKIDIKKFRCLVFGTDGLWNVISPKESVEHVRNVQEQNEDGQWEWVNASKCLVEVALKKWSNTKMRADNISVITIMLYPPGPPPKYAMKQHCNLNLFGDESIEQPFEDYDHYLEDQVTMYDHNTHEEQYYPGLPSAPSNSIAIMTRYDKSDEVCSMNSFAEFYENSLYNNPQENLIVNKHNQQNNYHNNLSTTETSFNSETYSLTKLQTRTEQINSIRNFMEFENNSQPPNEYPINFPSPLEFHDYRRSSDSPSESSSSTAVYATENNEHSFSHEADSLPSSFCEESDISIYDNRNEEHLDESIQINEITSSSITAATTTHGLSCSSIETNISSKIVLPSLPESFPNLITPINNTIITEILPLSTEEPPTAESTFSSVNDENILPTEHNTNVLVNNSLPSTLPSASSSSILRNFEPPVTRSKDLLLHKLRNSKHIYTKKLHSKKLIKRLTKVQIKTPKNTSNTTSFKTNNNINIENMIQKSKKQTLPRTSGRLNNRLPNLILSQSSSSPCPKRISKRISMKNANWGPAKSATQARKRIQKCLSHS